MTQNIVVAYDGSDHSERALDWAILEAQKRQEPLKIVLSMGRRTGLDQSIYGAFADALHQESERLATRAVEKAKAGGVTGQGIIERGDADISYGLPPKDFKDLLDAGTPTARQTAQMLGSAELLALLVGAAGEPR